MKVKIKLINLIHRIFKGNKNPVLYSKKTVRILLNHLQIFKIFKNFNIYLNKMIRIFNNILQI